jgi:hypothetical protein
MNICIVTVYNSENCGSFYQAYALYKTLENQGHNVVFLKRDTLETSHSKKTSILNSLKSLARGRLSRAFNYLRKYHAFEKATKIFKIVENYPDALKDIDCFVIGSDTLWNFESKYFYKRNSIYTGLELPDKRKITYAVSIANTPIKVITDDNSIVKGIKQLDAISVRDVNTAEAVKRVSETTPTQVLDPTFLLDELSYQEMEAHIDESDYILIYGFGDISPEMKSQLVKISVILECKIVSYGEYRKWADVNTIYDPTTFLSYFRNARYVVTNTYHGTIFSIIYKKNFVCYGQAKNKVRDLVESLKLTEQFISPNESILDKLKQTPDYENANKILEERKYASINYLLKSIEG